MFVICDMTTLNLEHAHFIWDKKAPNMVITSYYPGYKLALTEYLALLSLLKLAVIYSLSARQCTDSLPYS